MRSLNISRSIGDICSRYESSTLCAGGSANDSNSGGYIQKSSSEVISKRGFKPSDCDDPQKKQFLTSLSNKIWKKSFSENELLSNIENNRETFIGDRKKIDIRKLFTPASDFDENCICPHTHRKMYASSSFYSSQHPTVEEQLELARRISRSLSDISNQRSKGQSMYVNRKKKSVKWTHEGEGKGAPAEEHESCDTEEKSEKKKILKLVMNPRGQVQNLQSLRKMGYNIEPGALSPEVCFDLVKDMQETRGKGAELFAKRRKKSEKWVIEGNGHANDGNMRRGEPANGYTTTCTEQYERTFHRNGQGATEDSKYFSESSTNDSFLSAFSSSFQSSDNKWNMANVKPKFSEDLYKPKIPRGWNAAGQKPKPQSCNSDVNSEIASTLPAHYNPYSEGNNFNTAPRGWKPTMDYYRPVTFQRRPNSYTDF